jgi:hypothetical protein
VCSTGWKKVSKTIKEHMFYSSVPIIQAGAPLPNCLLGVLGIYNFAHRLLLPVPSSSMNSINPKGARP